MSNQHTAVLSCCGSLRVVDRISSTEKETGKSSFLVCMLMWIEPYAIYFSAKTRWLGSGPNLEGFYASLPEGTTGRYDSGRVGPVNPYGAHRGVVHIYCYSTGPISCVTGPGLIGACFSCTYHNHVALRRRVVARRRLSAQRRARVRSTPEARREGTKRGAAATGAAAAEPALLVGSLGFYLLAFHALSNPPLSDPLLYGIHAVLDAAPSGLRGSRGRD